MSATVLAGLEPAAPFRWFEALCAIPHGSGRTEAIGEFCVNFAKERGLRCRRDAAGNVVIWKDASPGYEDHAPVILQGHLDMVCEKDPDCDIDFQKDGLRLAVDGDRLFAQGTTLGGDDGIAAAYALAVLDDPALPHPPLEVLLTADEEIGMLGAAALDTSGIEGRTLINLDSEEEGILTVSCAGGATVTLSLPIRTAPADALSLFRLELGGLEGGHSGEEIHKGRGNANKLLGEALDRLDCAAALRLAALSGGAKDNVIPRNASALFAAPAEAAPALGRAAEGFARVLRERYPAEPEVFVRLTAADGTAPVWDRETTARALCLLREVPNGVQTMSRDIEGLVETSLNLGVLRCEDGALKLGFLVRSSVDRDKQFLRRLLADLAARRGAGYDERGVYPAWEYKKDSRLRERMVEVYEAKFGQKPKIRAIHAGLECGLLAGKLPGLDSVSCGPDMSGVHTARETLSLSSTARVWQYLLAVLARL